MVAMDMPSFVNNVAFGERMRQIRDEVVLASLETVARHDGPSPSLQSRIENGQALTITDETIKKYETAFAALSGEAFPRELGSGFLAALVTAYHAAEGGQEQVDARTSRINSMAQYGQAPWASRGIFLGLDLGELETPVIGASISRIMTQHGARVVTDEDPAPQGFNLGSLPVRWARDIPGFDELLVQLIDRQQSITVAGASDTADRVARLMEAAGRGVHTDVESRLDPITAITSLSVARRRAEAFGAPASGNNNLNLAWMILLANAVGHKQGVGAYTAWSRHSADVAVWKSAIATVPDAVRGGMPDVRELMGAADLYLTAWTGSRRDSPKEVELSFDGDEIAWGATDWEMGEPIEPAAGDLWIYGGHLLPNYAGEGRVDKVLAEMGIPSVLLLPNGLEAGGPQVEAPDYEWCPSGVRPEFVLLRARKARVWRAVQIR